MFLCLIIFSNLFSTYEALQLLCKNGWTRLVSNNLEKDNKIAKKKALKRNEALMNSNGVCMKGIVIGEKVDGRSEGISPLDKLKEFMHQKLNKVSDHDPLSMYDLTIAGSGPQEIPKAIKESKETLCSPPTKLVSKSHVLKLHSMLLLSILCTQIVTNVNLMNLLSLMIIRLPMLLIKIYMSWVNSEMMSLTISIKPLKP